MTPMERYAILGEKITRLSQQIQTIQLGAASLREQVRDKIREAHAINDKLNECERRPLRDLDVLPLGYDFENQLCNIEIILDSMQTTISAIEDEARKASMR